MIKSHLTAQGVPVKAMPGYIQLASSFTDEKAKLVLRSMKEKYFRIAEMLAAVSDIQALETKAAETAIWKAKYIGALEDIRDRTKKKERAFTDEDKAFILALHNDNMSQSDIVRRTGWNKGTVSNIINYGTTSGRLK